MPAPYSDINPTESITSDRLHNHNCYLYLHRLVLGPLYDASCADEAFHRLVTELPSGKYYSNYSYGKLYSDLLMYVEEHLEHLCSIIPAADLDPFLYSIYDNNNHILENSFKHIQEIPNFKTPSSKSVRSQVQSKLQDLGDRVNKEVYSPADKEKAYNRFRSTYSRTYKPQLETNLSTIRACQWNDRPLVREYRFGTQAQRHEGQVRISPLFEKFIEIQKEKSTPERPITHVYFNCLARDRFGALAVEGKREKALTAELEKLENEHDNLVVVTLPSDRGLMASDHYRKTHTQLDKGETIKGLLAIAAGEGPEKPYIKDFHINNKARDAIFRTADAQSKILATLLNNSLETLGYNDNKKVNLSHAERQALWFHFIKFELTDHIIRSQKPHSINFSCKDAIDRGSVASAYYNLLQSFKPGNVPMCQDEFNMALHAAPSMVKGRGMNHHVDLIWNAVDAYVNANYATLSSDPDKSWLITWVAMNCPHARVPGLLKLRIQQSLDDVNAELLKPDLTENRRQILTKGLDVLKAIEKLGQENVSGNRLLLESTSLTRDLCLSPQVKDEAALAHYEMLRKDLIIFFPAAQYLAGCMKILWASVAYAVSAGKCNFFASAQATKNIGCKAAVKARQEMRQGMQSLLNETKPAL